MTSLMTAVVAREHADDLRRAAGRPRRTPSYSATTKVPAIELRLAHPAEAHVLTRLAQLDDARELEGPVLLALIDDRAEAGLSLRDGRIVANPFVRTQEAVSLLRVRSALLSDARDPGHRLSRISAKLAVRLGDGRAREQARAGY